MFDTLTGFMSAFWNLVFDLVSIVSGSYILHFIFLMLTVGLLFMVIYSISSRGF